MIVETRMQKEIFAKTGEADCKNLFNVGQRSPKTGKALPVYETDLSVRIQIEELPMLPEFPSAARVSEYVRNL